MKLRHLFTKHYKLPKSDILERALKSFSPVEKLFSVVCIVLLILGVMLIGGGAFYLFYARKLRRAPPMFTQQRFARPQQRPMQRPMRLPPRPHALPGQYPARRRALRLAEEEKHRKLFAAFEPQAPKQAHEAPLPDITHLFRIAQPHDFERLAALARKYQSSKRIIEPRLSADERAVFERLAQVAQRARGRKLHEILSPVQERQLQDIFEQLARIIREHGDDAVFQQLRQITKK